MAQGFDLRTHYRNSKGNIERTDPYHLHIVDGIQRFERPIGSGDMYDAQGTLIVQGNKEAKQDAPSISDSKAAEMLAAENEALKAELAALKASAEPKAPPAIDLDKVLEKQPEAKPLFKK